MRRHVTGECAMGKLDGKVAFITGAARGQGRSHAVRLAEEGADIIAVDICAQIPTVDYPMSAPEDLAETVRLVEALDRRIVATQADVRDPQALGAGLRAGLAELGHVDIVLANAGIAMMSEEEPDPEAAWAAIIDVNLGGVWRTVRLAAPHMIERGNGGAIVITSSTAGLKAITDSDGPGFLAYTASKHGVVGLMRVFARTYAPHRIRVNTVHPTGVNTPMVVNDIMQDRLEEMGAGGFDALANLMPVDMVEPLDISNAIAWLVSDEARYVTGVTLPVDAGFTLR
jgi:SDR family mycofactocin-dependent oxidoreductase